MNTAFDNQKYIALQSEKIKERIAKFGNKLYLEFGGKLFDDFHASRVLPGFEPDAKIKMLASLSSEIEIILTISSEDIEKNKIRADISLSYKEEIFRLIEAFSLFGLTDISVVITKFSPTKNTDEFIWKLENLSIPHYFHYKIDNYPYDVDGILSENGFGKNDFVPTKKPLVIVTGPGPGSGKMATCLSQIYHEFQRGNLSGYSKFETFPVWNLPLSHPVNLAYESATIDLADVNMIDPFHLEKYGEIAVNYNRDIEIFPLLKGIFEKIYGNCPYTSPTDMGVNMVGFCFNDEEKIKKFAKNEIIRRYFSVKNEVFLGKMSADAIEKIQMIMERANIVMSDRPIVAFASQKEAEKNVMITAVELENGAIVTGKKSTLMTSAAACVINVLKNLAEINDEISIISPAILEAIQALKIKNENGIHTELGVNDVLIAISVSAITSPVADMAMKKLDALRGLDSHSSRILEKSDFALLKKLGLSVSMEAKYE